MNRGDRVVVDTDQAEDILPASPHMKTHNGTHGALLEDSDGMRPLRVQADSGTVLLVNPAYLRPEDALPTITDWAKAEQRRVEQVARVGHRYWQYDAEADTIRTRDHWVKVRVEVDKHGVSVFYPAGVLNPGASRWVGNRLIEAAALFELLFTEKGERTWTT
jgi:hypothetical protein